MITVTDAAIAAIVDIQKKQDNVNIGLRLSVVGGGCAGFSYKLDLKEEKKEGDWIYEKNGAFVFVDPKSLKLLDGLELDYFTTMSQRGFRFNNPNAKATCGCGTSFSLT
ncbi:MAG: iron-sulfur cluster assembly accessory protein [Deltaproteobacteria bacterium]|nr:iron-sulfur cluster assembly accessory protein [Deltaproteobacteria bacterium]